MGKQITFLIQKFYLHTDWAEKINVRLEQDKVKLTEFAAAFFKKREKNKNNQSKTLRLLDSYLEQDIEKEVSRQEKQKFFSAFRAAESVGKIPESLILVPSAGFEPAVSRSATLYFIH